MIDDVLGLIVLAVVSGFAKGGLRLIHVGITAALAITFTIVLAKRRAPAMRRAAPAVQARLCAGETQFTIAMITLLSLSALAHTRGMPQSSALSSPVWP